MYEEKRNWLVIQTFWKREKEVSTFLREKGVDHFIPMTYKERLVGSQEKPKRMLVPVIHNYVFLEKTMTVREISSMMGQSDIPMRLFKNKGSDAPCEISNQDMFEFRMLCDPAYSDHVIVKEGEDDVEIGKEVVIMHGQFAGIHGRLVRKQHKYWFIKTVAGISVMLRITRWYCKPVG